MFSEYEDEISFLKLQTVGRGLTNSKVCGGIEKRDEIQMSFVDDSA